MASTAEIELSVKHDDSEDESSSDSDDDTKQVMSHEYLHQQMDYHHLQKLLLRWRQTLIL